MDDPIDWDPNQKYAFYDATTLMLTCWGYVASNCSLFKAQCDIRVEVPWDFEYPIGPFQENYSGPYYQWKWGGSDWEKVLVP